MNAVVLGPIGEENSFTRLKKGLTWIGQGVVLFIRTYPFEIAMAFLAAAMIGGFFGFFFALGDTTAYGDGISKLNNARRMFDNVGGEFHLAQVGTIWLPAMSLLEALTINVDYLYRTGLSGSVWSMLFFIVSVVFVGKVVKEWTGSYLGALVASLVILLNPNLIYFGTTPMAESLLVAMTAVCAYCLVRLERNPHSMKWLVISSLALTSSLLVRYEFWFYTLLLVPVISFSFWLKGFRGKKLIGRLTVLYFMQVLPVFAWVVIWEWGLVGDPLYFARSQYSAKWIDVFNAGRTMSVHHLRVAVWEVYSAMSLNFTAVLVGLAVLGAVVLGVRLVLGKERMLTPLYLLGTPVFFVVSLYLGDNAIEVDPSKGLFINIRYGTVTAVFVAVFCGYLVALAWRYRFSIGPLKPVKLISLGLAATTVALSVELLVKPLDAVVLKDSNADSSQSQQINSEMEEANFLKDRYGNGQLQGLILAESFGTNNSVMFFSGVPLQRFITENNPAVFYRVLDDPANYATWIMVRNKDGVDKILSQTKVLDQYQLVFRNNFGQIYQIKNPEAAVGNQRARVVTISKEGKNKPFFTSMKSIQ